MCGLRSVWDIIVEAKVEQYPIRWSCRVQRLQKRSETVWS